MTPAPRCLVVDRDHEFLDQVKRCFAASGLSYALVIFASSVEALEFARQNKVDLVLTGYLMPQIDGLHLVASIRSFNPTVPIVMISDFPAEAAALRRGATAFLDKAALWAQLESCVRKVEVKVLSAIAA